MRNQIVRLWSAIIVIIICAAVLPLASVPHCVYEDGSSSVGLCVWDAHTDGNGIGTGTYLYASGSEVARW
ncbi:hypothetical protein BMAGN_1434 [Bifidobacterium magnum]|uniref:Uncharacterized protein n=1 Tax=Bifidobacterium magnum TaxID=1692 RepID=A0A087B676_9BIFI|nr:hypothetical protein BMAGN_1434 [Bifidobacterium magnum]